MTLQINTAMKMKVYLSTSISYQKDFSGTCWWKKKVKIRFGRQKFTLVKCFFKDMLYDIGLVKNNHYLIIYLFIHFNEMLDLK